MGIRPKTCKAVAAALIMIAVHAGAIPAIAATTATVEVVLTLADLSVTQVAPAGGLSLTTPAGGVIVSEAVVMRNDGNVSQTYELSVSLGGTWQLNLALGTLTVNQVRLSAMWQSQADSPAASEFDADDILSTSPQASTLG